MNLETIGALKAINRRFYETLAEDFNATRLKPWVGWKRVEELVERRIGKSKRLKVLDLGCGNGRFGRYLHDKGYRLEYVGVDGNERLLNLARKSLGEVAQVSLIRSEVEAVGGLVERGSCEVVVAMGLVHHLPSGRARMGLMKKAALMVKPGGMLVVSLWQFMADKRQKKKVVAWNDTRKSGFGIDESELEEGDWLLSWQNKEGLVRYCHQVTKKEEGLLVRASGLRLMEVFKADGKEGGLNRYLVLSRRN